MITAQLAAASPHLLKYLLVHSVASASMSPTDVFTFTNQANQATPDLRTDATTGRTNARTASAPLLTIMRIRLDGDPLAGSAAAAQSQGQARARLASDQVGGLLTEPHQLSAELFITPRSDPGGRFWTADASVDASGDPIVIVRVQCLSGSVLGGAGLGPVGARAMLTIRCRHTADL